MFVSKAIQVYLPNKYLNVYTCFTLETLDKNEFNRDISTGLVKLLRLILEFQIIFLIIKAGKLNITIVEYLHYWSL